MRHPEPDDLALFAVSTGPDLDDHAELSAHLTGCPVCQAEVDAFRYVAELVRDEHGAEALPAPGAHVWDAIADELGLSHRHGQPVARLTAVPDVPTTPEPTPATLPPVVAPVDEARPASESPRAPEAHSAPEVPVDLAARSRRRSRWTLAAAALVVGAALGAGAIAVTQKSGDPDPTQVEAIATLDPVPGGPLTEPDPTLGRAELVAVDGAQRVVVDTEKLPAITGAYEVWLFGNDGKMVSLGSLDAGRGDFTVPQGIDTSEYRTIDISDEPADGNPTHSGLSVVRGTFS